MNDILCVNVGSSTVKTALFDTNLNELGRAVHPDISALKHIGRAPAVVAHRLVHGGPNHSKPVVIDEELIKELHRLSPLAPLHLPPALDALDEARQMFPEAVHVACFDTAFHHTIPDVAATYALPRSLIGPEIRRYGFHGLSCEHVVRTLGEDSTRRCVIAHLGSGCSVTAVRNGESVDNSMGFTPAGGLVMATRPGDLDPGLMLYLIEHGNGARDLANTINHEAGLAAIAGTPDMRDLLQRTDTDARLAVEMFCYRVVQFIGAYATTLGGVDTLVFTGGIGENSHEVRARIVDSLSILRPFTVEIVPANEELVMAQQALSLTQG